MTKKLLLLLLAFIFTSPVLFAQDEEDTPVAEIGDTAVNLSTLQIYRGSNQATLKNFSPPNYNVVVFWQFAPEQAKPRRRMSKEAREEAKKMREDSYAVHEELFKVRMALISQGTANRVRLVAVNGETAKETNKYLDEVARHFQERATKKGEDNKLMCPIFNRAKNAFEEKERNWEMNYALAYDKPQRPATRIPKGENPILRGRIWQAYMNRFGYKDDAPKAFIIGKPSEEEAKEIEKRIKEKEKENKKRKKKKGEVEYPELVNSRVLWVGDVSELHAKLQEFLRKDEKPRRRR